MIAIFTLTVNPETQEMSFIGNIEPKMALPVLQQIVIMEAVKEAEKAKEVASKEAIAGLPE